MAAALASLDRARLDESARAMLDEAYKAPRAQTLGLTGPPGVGKSTLIDALIRLCRERGLSVGVIAVDPSSQRSGGALLGDRVRMRTDPEDESVFVRSLASRGRLGGLSEAAFGAAILMRAIYDRVIVESVGVGQSEADIAAVADTVALCVQPGSGDSMQFMKAGIMEIPHIAAVTKADAGPAASRALAELKGALGLAAPADPEWETPCLAVSATTGHGVAELAAQAERHFAWLSATGRLAGQRRAQAESWLRRAIALEFGRRGVAALGDGLRLAEEESPFAKEAELTRRLAVG